MYVCIGWVTGWKSVGMDYKRPYRIWDKGWRTRRVAAAAPADRLIVQFGSVLCLSLYLSLVLVLPTTMVLSFKKKRCPSNLSVVSVWEKQETLPSHPIPLSSKIGRLEFVYLPAYMCMYQVKSIATDASHGHGCVPEKRVRLEWGWDQWTASNTTELSSATHTLKEKRRIASLCRCVGCFRIFWLARLLLIAKMDAVVHKKKTSRR